MQSITQTATNPDASNGKPLAISKSNWAQQPDFNYHFNTVSTVLVNELLPLISQLCWLLAAILFLQYSSNWVKTI